MTQAPFIAVPSQSFSTFQEWVDTASYVLTRHQDYLNTEHEGPDRGWRGHHFTAMCFDQKGRRCRMGADFMLADREGMFPVWWVWPDQINDLLRYAISRED